MKPHISLLYIGLLVLAVACKPGTVATPQELTGFVLDEENGLYKKRESNGVLIELQIHPNDLIVSQEIEGMNYRPSQVDSIRKKLDSIIYFKLSLSRNGQEAINLFADDEPRFKRGIDYLSGGINEDLKLVQNNDTTDVQGTMYMRSYGMSKASKLLVAFKRDKSNEAVTFLYNDSFFNTGLNKFDFRVSDLKNIPTLIL